MTQRELVRSAKEFWDDMPDIDLPWMTMAAYAQEQLALFICEVETRISEIPFPDIGAPTAFINAGQHRAIVAMKTIAKEIGIQL